MSKNGWKSIWKKKFKITTNSNHSHPVCRNHLQQEFSSERLNQVWVSDITYIKTAEGWLYLTCVMDLFDRKIIGWSISSTLKTADTSVSAIDKAFKSRRIKQQEPLVFHSDRGIQYAAREFSDKLIYRKITRSMSGKGNCYDNAVAESFFKTLKAELVYQNSYKTREQEYLSVFEYIEGFYNTHRRHSKLGNLTIKEFTYLINNQIKKVA